MVKGISKRVVVVDAPDPRFFEQAIFILRSDAAGEGVSSRALVEEARRIARDYAAGSGRKRDAVTPALYTLLGAGIIALVWLAVAMLV